MNHYIILTAIIIFFLFGCNHKQNEVDPLVLTFDEFESKIDHIYIRQDSSMTNEEYITSIRIYNTLQYYDSLKRLYADDYLPWFYHKHLYKMYDNFSLSPDLHGWCVSEKYNIYLGGRKHSNSYYTVLGFEEKGLLRKELMKKEHTRDSLTQNYIEYLQKKKKEKNKLLIDE